MAATDTRGSRGAVAALVLLVIALGLVAALLVLFPPPTTRPGLPAVEPEGGSQLTLLLLPLIGVLAVSVGGFLIPFLLRRREEGRLDASTALAAAGELRSRIPTTLLLSLLRPILLVVGALLVGAAVVTTLPVVIGLLTTPSALDPAPISGLNLAPLLSFAIVILLVLFLVAAIVAVVRRRLASRPQLPKEEPLPPVETLVAEPLRYTPPSDPARPALAPEVAALFADTETPPRSDGPRRPSRILRLLLAPFRLIASLLTTLLVADYYLVRGILRLPLRLVGKGDDRRAATTAGQATESIAVRPEFSPSLDTSLDTSLPAATPVPATQDPFTFEPAPTLLSPILNLPTPTTPMKPEPPLSSQIAATETVPSTPAPLLVARPLTTPLTGEHVESPTVAAPMPADPSLETLLADLGSALDKTVPPPPPTPSTPSLDRDPFADLPAVAAVAEPVTPPDAPLLDMDPFAGLEPVGSAAAQPWPAPVDTAAATEPTPTPLLDPLPDLFADLTPVFSDVQLAEPRLDPLPDPAEPAPIELPPVLVPLSWTPETAPLPFEPIAPPTISAEIDTPVERAPLPAVAPGAPVTIFVVALAPQSGKSTVAAEAARLLETIWINSSAVIAERVEQRLGLPYGYVAETRAADHEAFRPELIEEGDRMSAEGTSPGVECVRRGYRVIDGIRRREELEAAIAEVRAGGGKPVVFCVRRPNAPALADNTEAAALEAMADEVLVNDAGLDQLRALTAAALQRHQAA